MFLVSIIIPIYNIGGYIERCFSSIYNQGVDDNSFEILAINDGSTDNSSEEVRKFQKQHCNIKLIEKENGGVSSARNIGISEAKGKYIIFVDPDDALIPDSMTKLIEFCSGNDDPVVFFRIYERNEKELYSWMPPFFDGDIKDCVKVLNSGYFKGSVCGGGYLNSFVRAHRLRFPLGMKNGEDTTFLTFAMYYSKYIRFKDILLYNVLGREGSASRTFSKQRIQTAVDSLAIVDDLIARTDVKSPILQYLRYQLRSNLIADTLKTTGLSLSKLYDMGFCLSYKIECPGLKFQKWKIALMNFSPRLFYYLFKIKK